MQAQKQIVLTLAGIKKIEEELDLLRTVHRRRVAERMRNAHEAGVELEDNTDLEDARNELAYIEGRIDELREIVSTAVVIEKDDIATDVIGIGTTVKVRDMETNDEWEWSIVGTFEADPAEDRISDESPVGKALVNKKVGDIAVVEIPAGRARYEILAINK